MTFLVNLILILFFIIWYKCIQNNRFDVRFVRKPSLKIEMIILRVIINITDLYTHNNMNMYFILFNQFFSTVTMIKFIYTSFFIIIIFFSVITVVRQTSCSCRTSIRSGVRLTWGTCTLYFFLSIFHFSFFICVKL